MLKIPRQRAVPIRMEMSPLIDCIFLLLVFFLLSSTFLTPSLQLDLPEATASNAGQAAQVVLTIDREGRLFVNKREVSMATMRAEILQAVDGIEQPAVTIRGDKAMRYEVFVRALNVIQSCGIANVRMAHVAE